jgi:hypothetical protein
VTSRPHRTLVHVLFAALIVAATFPSWRLLLPGASAEEAILQSLCSTPRTPPSTERKMKTQS